MAFLVDPGRPPGIHPLENIVPDQGNVDQRAMLPLAPVREQQHHDVRQHAGLGHAQHDEDMNLEDMLPLGQAFNLDQDDAMLEDDNNQLREQVDALWHGASKLKGVFRVNGVMRCVMLPKLNLVLILLLLCPLPEANNFFI